MNSRDKIISILKKKDKVRPADLLLELKISEAGFYKQIKTLLTKGVIFKIGSGPHIFYQLNTIQTPQTLGKELVPILKKNCVTKAAFFGSFARGDNRLDSDIDLLVNLKPNKSLLDLIGLEQELKDKFNKDFDIITFNSLNSRLKDYVYNDLISII